VHDLNKHKERNMTLKVASKVKHTLTVQ